MTTAAAMTKSKTIKRVTNVHMGIPQHLRRLLDFSLLSPESVMPARDCMPPDGHLDRRLLAAFGVPDRKGVS